MDHAQRLAKALKETFGPNNVQVVYQTTAAPRAEQRAFSVKQAAVKLGVSVGKVYALCRSGELDCNRIGRRVTITAEQLASYRPQAKSRYDTATCSALRRLG